MNHSVVLVRRMGNLGCKSQGWLGTATEDLQLQNTSQDPATLDMDSGALNYRVKSLTLGLDISPISTLGHPHPEILYILCLLLSSLLLLAPAEAARLLEISLPINPLCEVRCVVWLSGIPWFLTLRIPFPSDLQHFLETFSHQNCNTSTGEVFPVRAVTIPLGNLPLEQSCNTLATEVSEDLSGPFYLDVSGSNYS